MVSFQILHASSAKLNLQSNGKFGFSKAKTFGGNFATKSIKLQQNLDWF
jgi:hypothetical protein